MKLTGREATAYFRKPDPEKAGLLIFGQDGMRVALRRQEVVLALIGPDGADEMRLTRLAAADLRKDPAALLDGVKAQGFFPGPRAVLVEDATDGLTDTFRAALTDWQPGDAQIVATAGGLNARSKLRKLFEDGRATVAIGIYDDPPSREEVETLLAEAGLRHIDRDGGEAIGALAQTLSPGDFRQTLEKLSLYKLGDDGPLTAAEVTALAPAQADAATDDLIDVVADGEARAIGPILSRLKGQGVTPVALSIAATRHFRALHTAAADPGGPGSGIARLRPPVWGARRDRMIRQARDWGMIRLEEALSILIDADLTLRSARPVPAMGLIERTFLRLAMLRQKR